MILERAVHDYDITTSALPDEVISIFDKTVPTGLKFGTVTVLLGDNHVEVTTMRKDGKYEDSRRPEDVVYTKDLTEDLARRDFTINAIAMNLDGLKSAELNCPGKLNCIGKIIDPFSGSFDICYKKIIAVGNPVDRFTEDALRMLRAVRFSCQLGFTIGLQTRSAIEGLSKTLTNISAERIRDEFVKIILCDNPSHGIFLLRSLELLPYIMPELEKTANFDQRNPNHHKTIFGHTMLVLDAAPARLNTRLGAILHDIGKPDSFSIGENGVGHFYGHPVVGAPIANNILRRLKFDNATVDIVTKLVKEHMSRYPFLRSPSLKRLINRVGGKTEEELRQNLTDLFDLQRADIEGSKPPWDFSLVDNMKVEVERILAEKEPLRIKDLAITGNDLKASGFVEGPEIGICLKMLVNQVHENPTWNTKEKLLEIVKMVEDAVKNYQVPKGDL
jgi:tRNA nucleotidyltransferase (CCA-adding enzyme)